MVRRRSHNEDEIKRRTGFTLIELMIVLVIMGVLAAVALVSYQTYIRRARSAEAAGLIANVKAAQESYRSEFGMYCNVKTYNPGWPPGPDPQDWAIVEEWTQLGFQPNTKRLYFSLNTYAGGPDGAIPGNWNEDTAATLPAVDATFTQNHWFIATALGDQDDDGDHSIFWTTHMQNQIDSLNVTE